MSENKRIKTALVSVYHKDGLDEILKKLHAEGVSFVSTGGTNPQSLNLFRESHIALSVPNHLLTHDGTKYHRKL